MRSKRTGARFYAAEIFAALMHSPRTLAQLRDRVGVSDRAARAWVRELRASGLIYVSGFDSRHLTGPRERIYSLQPKPFEIADATYQPKGVA